MKPLFILSLIVLYTITANAQLSTTDPGINKEIAYRLKHRDIKKRYPGYPRYTNTDTVNDLRYYAYDSAKLYVWANEKVSNELFAYGLLSNASIYCALANQCSPQVKGLSHNLDAGDLNDSFILSKPTIIIGTCQQVKYFTNNQKRVYLMQTYFKGISGWDFFILEIENKKATKKTDERAFIKGAKVTYFERFYSDI